jgi:hypothetical protein
MSETYELLFDGRTLVATILLDVHDNVEAYEAGLLIHETCRSPHGRMVAGSSQDATDKERAELGEMLANYGVIVRPPRTVRHKFAINTDEETEPMALRLRGALNPRNMRAMIIVGESDTDEARKLWRLARRQAKRSGLIR